MSKTRTFTPGPESTIKGTITITTTDDGTRTMTDASGRTWPCADAQLERIERYMIETTQDAAPTPVTHNPTFWTLTKSQRRTHYANAVKAGDIVRPSRDPLVWLVSSDTLSKQYGRPVYWRVDILTATCHCPGSTQRGCCRHVAAAIMAAWHATHVQPANVIPFPVAA